MVIGVGAVLCATAVALSTPFCAGFNPGYIPSPLSPASVFTCPRTRPPCVSGIRTGLSGDPEVRPQWATAGFKAACSPQCGSGPRSLLALRGKQGTPEEETLEEEVAWFAREARKIIDEASPDLPWFDTQILGARWFLLRAGQSAKRYNSRWLLHLRQLAH